MDQELTSAAYHEAGHALVAHLLGGELVEVTLESEQDEHDGRTSVAWRGFDAHELARRTALVALAGPVAETFWRGEELLYEDLSAWRADWAEVDAALERADAPSEHEALRRRWLAEVANELLDSNAWEYVCRIADALEAHGTLDASLLDELLPPLGNSHASTEY